MDKCPAKQHHSTPPSAFTWRKLTPPKRVTRNGWPGNPPPRWGTPSLRWMQSRKKDRLYGKIGNPTKGGGGGNSSTWGPPPPCEHTLSVNLVQCSLRSLAVLSNLKASAQSSEVARNYLPGFSLPGSLRLWRSLSRLPRFPNAFKLLKNHQATQAMYSALFKCNI